MFLYKTIENTTFFQGRVYYLCMISRFYLGLSSLKMLTFTLRIVKIKEQFVIRKTKKARPVHNETSRAFYYFS